MDDVDTIQYLAPSCCHERLRQMIHLAQELRSKKIETSAVTLDLLSSLIEEDIVQLKDTRTLQAENIERLAQSVNRPREIVRELLRKYLLKDLLDYAGYYSTRFKAYSTATSSGDLDRRLQFRYGSPNEVVLFIYHQMVYCWEIKHRVLSMPMDDNSRFACLYEGFLVANNLSFATTVDLLAASMQRQWQGWEDLWKYF